ncbi:MAG: TrkA family potassium uptake protein [Dehalococcoidales bacterium]|nr:TrkA family potassium uptake protein [Dehalococcoidales bacterium]
MSKQVAVIGLGRFGTSLAIALHDAGYDVLAIDKSTELVDSIGAHVTHAVRTNSTNEAALQKLGIGGFDVAVVSIGDVQDSVMTTILLKKMGVRYIVAKADNDLHGEILASIGADKVIFPERDTAIRTGPMLTMRDVSDFIPLGNGSGIVKVKAMQSIIGRTLEGVGFDTNDRGNVVVLMIQRGKECIVNPNPQEVISHVDVLILAGNNIDIEKLFEKIERQKAKSPN